MRRGYKLPPTPKPHSRPLLAKGAKREQGLGPPKAPQRRGAPTTGQQFRTKALGCHSSTCLGTRTWSLLEADSDIQRRMSSKTYPHSSRPRRCRRRRLSVAGAASQQDEGTGDLQLDQQASDMGSLCTGRDPADLPMRGVVIRCSHSRDMGSLCTGRDPADLPTRGVVIRCSHWRQPALARKGLATFDLQAKLCGGVLKSQWQQARRPADLLLDMSSLPEQTPQCSAQAQARLRLP